MGKKKLLNAKGFTLIELLAVIVIMGILMMVAIPAMTTFMENARKDTFISIAESYVNAARYKVLNDGYSCSSAGSTMSSSALSPGTYYIQIDKDGKDNLLEEPAVSPWGTANLVGYVQIDVKYENELPKYSYSILLEEDKNGVVRRGLYNAPGGTDVSDTPSIVSEKSLGREYVSSVIEGSLSEQSVYCTQVN